MKKYNVTMWYTVSRVKKIVVEADCFREAEDKAESLALDEDAETWKACDDVSFEIDVEEALA